MGYIQSDPNDPDYPRKIASKYFSAAHYTDVYRKNMEHMKGSYGDFEAYYVESLVLNGVKINSHPFAHHLNLTVEPGIYNAKITVVVKHHFAGYSPSKLASERLNASEFWPTNVAKKRWVRYLNLFDEMGFGWTFWSYKTISVGWWDSSWGLYVQKMHLYNRDENGELVVTTDPSKYVLKLDVRTATYDEIYQVWSNQETLKTYKETGLLKEVLDKYFDKFKKQIK